MISGAYFLQHYYKIFLAKSEATKTTNAEVPKFPCFTMLVVSHEFFITFLGQRTYPKVLFTK